MVLEQCRGVHFLDFGERFQKHTYLQNLASIQPRTSSTKMRARRPTQPRDLYTEKWQTLQGSFSAVSKQILQENMRLKALAEIYTMDSFALLYN